MSGERLEFDQEHDDALRRAALDSAPKHEIGDLAGWWIRVVAYVIDIVVLLIGLGILVGIGFAISDVAGIILLIAAAVIYLLAYWVYFEGGETGQTIGKRAAGIKVVSDDGSRAGYGRAFGRNLVARVVSLVPFLGLVDVLWPLWDGRKQCLHDKAGSTLVIRKS